MIEPSPGQRSGPEQVRLVNPERFSDRVLYVVVDQFETAREVRQEGAEEVSAGRSIGFVSSPDAAVPAAKHSPPHQDIPNSAKGTISMTQLQPGVTGAAAAVRGVDRSPSGRARTEIGTPADSDRLSEYQPIAPVAMNEW